MLRHVLNLCSTLRRFNRDEAGISLLYVTISLPAIIGFSLLAIDVGRLTSLQSSLQHGADSLALAGAAELDLRPDAIERSERAITNIVTTNTSLFATSVVTINSGAVSTCYLAALPANDVTPIASADCLDEAAPASNVAARFVQIIVTPVNFNTVFPATFVGAVNNTATSGAEAVAGFQAAVCDVTPMFVCNPYEPDPPGTPTSADFTDASLLLSHISDPVKRKRQFNMKQTGGNTAQYFPGNFGWLVPEGGDGNSGASALQEAVGRVFQRGCYVSSGVELRTGAITSIRFGFNTRFDMYDGNFNAQKNNPDYRPGLNNRKGYANDKPGNGQGGACNPDDSDRDITTERGYLYKDECFKTDSCGSLAPLNNSRIGDGDWNKSAYWSNSHDGASLPGPISGANVSRYDVYKYELEDLSNRVNNDSNGPGNGANLGGELGGPMCYNGPSGSVTATPDRRIFHAAVLNCKALNASTEYGPIQGGSGNKLPVAAFGKFFLTEPVGGDRGNSAVADGDVWAELVDVSVPGQADGVARDIVQLYR